MSEKVFISGALTGIQNPDLVKGNYERLARLCEKSGLEVYVPHQHSDPLAHPHVPAQQVYEMDKYHVRTAGLVIAYVGIPSLGVGQEIEIAQTHAVPVLLLCERGRPLSRMTRGSPNVIAEIRFDDFEEALHQVKTILARDIEMINTSMAISERGQH